MSDTCDPSTYTSAPIKGSGPAVIILPGNPTDEGAPRALCDTLSEEGYLALAPMGQNASLGTLSALIDLAHGHTAHLGGTGMVAFSNDALTAWDCAGCNHVDCAVIYGDSAFISQIGNDEIPSIPVTLHLSGDVTDDALAMLRRRAETHQNFKIFAYADAATGFAQRGNAGHDPQLDSIAYSRTIGALKRAMGPHYNLEELWDFHIACEFRDKDAGAAMRTMVPEPYVNHVPTLTGGVGFAMLKRFYSDHFVTKIPSDRRSIPISQTVGQDRLVDEKIFCFTHDCEIDWLLPGVTPTGKYVEIPLVGIISFRGDKLVNEHLYWDQASVLVQIGLLDPAGLPVSGREQAQKLLDPSRPSNDMMPGWARSDSHPA